MVRKWKETILTYKKTKEIIWIQYFLKLETIISNLNIYSSKKKITRTFISLNNNYIYIYISFFFYINNITIRQRGVAEGRPETLVWEDWQNNIVNWIVSAATSEIVLNNVVLMTLFSWLCPCFRKGGATSDAGGDHHDDPTEPGDSLDLIFDLHTLQLATNFFSSLNQLGHGGFGPVFKVPFPFLLFKFQYLICCLTKIKFAHFVLGSCHFKNN